MCSICLAIKTVSLHIIMFLLTQKNLTSLHDGWLHCFSQILWYINIHMLHATPFVTPFSLCLLKMAQKRLETLLGHLKPEEKGPQLTLNPTAASSMHNNDVIVFFIRT